MSKRRFVVKPGRTGEYMDFYATVQAQERHWLFWYDVYPPVRIGNWEISNYDEPYKAIDEAIDLLKSKFEQEKRYRRFWDDIAFHASKDTKVIKP